MAPNLPAWKHDLIRDMIQRGSLTISQMADAAECSERSITNIRSNLRLFNDTRAPRNPAGRPPSITPLMREALCEHLLEKPGLYLDEMVVFLWDEFEVLVTKSSISRTLSSHGWSKKVIQQRAQCRSSGCLYPQYFRVLFISSGFH